MERSGPQGPGKRFPLGRVASQRKSGAAIQGILLVAMSEPDQQPRVPRPRKPVLERPWWRTPFQYLLRVRPRQRHLRGSLVHRLLGSRLFEPSLWVPGRESLASGVAIGVFFGMLPLIGLQILLSAVLCYFMRANIAAAAFATLVSNPFTAPGLIWMQLKLGHWLAPAFAR